MKSHQGNEFPKANRKKVIAMKKSEQENIITVSHLNKEFVKDGTSFQVLKDIDLSVKKGEFVTIVGHSGCGKSTLLKIICGLVSYQDGGVSRNGHAVSGPDAQCGMVFQDHRLLPWLKIKDNIGFGIRNMTKAEREEHIARHLELVGLKGFENAYPSQLSGGMSQRVAIARGLAGNPSILLLDEPTSALDPELVGEVLTVIRDLAAHGMPMIMVTHQMEFARAVATEILFMEAGRVIEQGSPEELLAPGAQTRTQDFCTRLYELCGDVDSAQESRN